MLFDSNIVIYAQKPEHGKLRLAIAGPGATVSAITYLEVLGYHGLTARRTTVLLFPIGLAAYPTEKNDFGTQEHRCPGPAG